MLSGGVHPMAESYSGKEDILYDCLMLCALPIGSPERSLRVTQLLLKWTAQTIWATIEEYPELFEWSVSVQGARLTAEGEAMLRRMS